MFVAVCSPSGGSVPVEFTRCLLDLQQTFIQNKIPHLFNLQTGSFLPHTRAKCLGAALERGPVQIPFNSPDITHLVLIDTDIIFKPNQVMKLIGSDADFVAGMYPYSTSAYLAEAQKPVVAGFWNETEFLKHQYFPPITIKEASDKAGANGLLEVDWVGLGFAVIKPSVFKKISYPWFQSELIKIGDYTDTTSEDVGFCRQVSRAKIPIMLDTNVRVKHLKSFEV